MKWIVSAVAVIAFTGWFLPLYDFGLGAVSFPASLDTFTNPSATDSTATVSHSGQHSDANDAIEALEAKVGSDGTSNTTTVDYKLQTVATGDQACSLTGTETLTNKTLTSPTINTPTLTTLTANTGTYATSTLTGSTTIDTKGNTLLFSIGSDATGDIYYRNSAAALTRLGAGADGQFLSLSGGLPSWVNNTPSQPSIDNGSTTSTYLLTTDGSEIAYVTAVASIAGDGTNRTIRLHYDGVEMDSVVVDPGGGGNSFPFTLDFASTTPNATGNVEMTVDNSTTSAQYTVMIF